MIDTKKSAHQNLTADTSMTLRLSTRVHFSLLSPSKLNSISRGFSSNLRRSSSISPIKMSSKSQIIEHIVLFKVKPDTDPSKIASMINGLNSLISLDQVVHLSAGALHRTRSPSLTFTHMLHSRYNSKQELAAYSAHPAHVSVVSEFVKPIAEDIMAVDWIGDDLSGPVALPAGSAIRVTFFKVKQDLGEKESDQVLGVIGGIKDKFPVMEQISFGKNFSPDRAKGYSIASLAVFPGLCELDAEVAELDKEKARDMLESVLVLDYVIQPHHHSASL